MEKCCGKNSFHNYYARVFKFKTVFFAGKNGSASMIKGNSLYKVWKKIVMHLLFKKVFIRIGRQIRFGVVKSEYPRK